MLFTFFTLYRETFQRAVCLLCVVCTPKSGIKIKYKNKTHRNKYDSFHLVPDKKYHNKVLKCNKIFLVEHSRNFCFYNKGCYLLGNLFEYLRMEFNFYDFSYLSPQHMVWFEFIIFLLYQTKKTLHFFVLRIFHRKHLIHFLRYIMWINNPVNLSQKGIKCSNAFISKRFKPIYTVIYFV